MTQCPLQSGELRDVEDTLSEGSGPRTDRGAVDARMTDDLLERAVVELTQPAV